MSLVTEIQTIVNRLYPDATFKLASEFNAAMATSAIKTDELPFVVLDNTIKKNNRIEKNASINKRTALKMYFVNKVNSDISDPSQNTVIEAMELMADRVFLNIYRLDSVRNGFNEVREYSTEPVFKIFADKLSGVIATATCKVNTIISWCTTEPVEEE